MLSISNLLCGQRTGNEALRYGHVRRRGQDAGAGVIEYRSSAFGGRLRNKLLVCRYNAGSDILCLTLDSEGNVASETAAIAGLTGFINPLDLTEDVRSGCV